MIMNKELFEKLEDAINKTLSEDVEIRLKGREEISNLRIYEKEAADFFTAYSFEIDYFNDSSNKEAACKAVEKYNELIESGYYYFLRKKVEQLKEILV